LLHPKNWITRRDNLLYSTCPLASPYLEVVFFGVTLLSDPSSFSIERRWSSRTFRYGYLVTT
jgi:hypothetical protein